MVDTKEVILNKWEIECMHTPETIDKLVMNFRKRGMSLNSLEYHKISEFKAKCVIEFEDLAPSAERIHSNMYRLEDVVSITRL
jgi:acetolactate synthase II small subunit